jgi:cytochrome c oxidase subunit 3
MADPQVAENHAAGGHAPGLAHHFDSYEQQQEASFFGMWVFLATEVMFFGGLFLAYIVYRSANPIAFNAGSNELDITLGAINTGVLIGSSLTMALAVHAAQLGRAKAIAAWMAATFVLGGTFLGIKVVEYSHKFHQHLFPGPNFFSPLPGEPVEMFFNLYFMMTGMHALHMIIGMGIMLVLIPLAWKGRFTPESHNYIEGFGLYWHFVDIVWIFLFPLLYLLGLA